MRFYRKSIGIAINVIFHPLFYRWFTDNEHLEWLPLGFGNGKSNQTNP